MTQFFSRRLTPRFPRPEKEKESAESAEPHAGDVVPVDGTTEVIKSYAMSEPEDDENEGPDDGGAAPAAVAAAAPAAGAAAH